MISGGPFWIEEIWSFTDSFLMALFGWNPKVGGTSVKDDSELLSWSSDFDIPKVLDILEIGNWNGGS